MTGPLVIYCDASAPHPNAEGDVVAGWGAVFVRDGKVAGEAKGSFKRCESVVAEFKAVRFSLEHALAEGLCASDTVIVASDCNGVERYLNKLPRGNGRKPRKELEDLADGILRVAAKAELELVVTWTKGHCPREPVHGRHNARADRLAREASGSVAAKQRKAAAANKANEERQRRESEALKAARRKAVEERPARRLERVLARVAQLEGRS